MDVLAQNHEAHTKISRYISIELCIVDEQIGGRNSLTYGTNDLVGGKKK